MKVLLIAPYYDRQTPGESWSTYKWVEGISSKCETTVLTTHRKGWDPAASPVRSSEIVNWDDPPLPKFLGRLNHQLKPTYAVFYHRARRWIFEEIRKGRTFDLVHQINPLALRYPTPARGVPFPYLMGPLAGSVETPAGFRDEIRDDAWFRKFRNLDRFRLRFDPWLRGSYAGAAALVGVAPYVGKLLEIAGCRRFEIASETGVESLSEIERPAPAPGEPLRLLFVGRIIRTKGVLDAVRAVAIASRKCALRFDVVGAGDQLTACRQEAERLGISDRVVFHGRQTREAVSDFYRQAHVFLFPSFREPSGNVVFEALGHGLPVITSSVGGPGYVVTDECGFRIPATNPDDYALRLSDAICSLASQPALVASMSAAGKRRMADIALWDNKISSMMNLYRELAPSGV